VKIHLNSLGCRLNEAELEQWAGDFSRAGDQVTDGVDDADIIVMNTCAVTKEAVRKSRQRTQRLQRANPSAKLVISGCYSTLETSSALAELGVDLIVPNNRKDDLVKMTRQAFEQPGMPEGATQPAETALFRRNRHRALSKQSVPKRCARGGADRRSCGRIRQRSRHRPSHACDQPASEHRHTQN